MRFKQPYEQKRNSRKLEKVFGQEGKERHFSFLKSANSEVIISEIEWNGRTLTIASPKVVHTHDSSIEKSCRLRHISLAHTYHHASAKFEQRRGYFFAVFSF